MSTNDQRPTQPPGSGGFTIEHVETLHEGWARLLLATVRRPDGDTMRREIEDHGAAVAVLTYDPDRRVAILIRQVRAPVILAGGEIGFLEPIAGLLDEDDPTDCARREAMEEAGLRLGSLEHVGSAWSMPGISTERMHLFLAAVSGSDRVAAGGGLAEEHEDIEVVEVPLSDLARMADAGELADMKLLVLIQTLRLRRPDLFA